MVAPGSCPVRLPPRLLWLSWSETRGCLPGNTEKHEPGSREEQQMREVRSQLGLAN